MPHGGILPPDKLADMILSQYVYKRHGRFSEDAARNRCNINIG